MQSLLILLAVSLSANLLFSTDSPERVLAMKALEAARDEKHRSDMVIEWPAEVSATMPRTLDVLIVRSSHYNSYTDYCLLQWRDGNLDAHLAKMNGPFSATKALRRLTIKPEVFTTSWKATRHLLATTTKPLVPVDRNEKKVRGSGSIRHASPQHLVQWREENVVIWSSLPMLENERKSNGLQNFFDLQRAAVGSVLWDLLLINGGIPDDLNTATSLWRNLWQEMLPQLPIDSSKRIETRSRLLVKDAACMFADFGEDNDSLLLGKIADSLRPTQAVVLGKTLSETYWEDSLREEIARSQERIAVRLHWNAESVMTSIDQNPRKTMPDQEQVQWLREQFLDRDPVTYLEFLSGCLNSIHDEDIIDSATELARCFPGIETVEIFRQIPLLLKHSNPEVVFAAAILGLGKGAIPLGSWFQNKNYADLTERASQNPLVFASLTALTRLVADPSIPIPPTCSVYSANARTSALGVLVQFPAPWVWDTAKIHKHLENPAEKDGRMIFQMLPMLDKNNTKNDEPALKAFAITVWRRCLIGDPTNCGVLKAMSELITLGDAESLPRIRELLAILKAGASEKYYVYDPQVRFPWAWTYELESLEKSSKGLEAKP